MTVRMPTVETRLINRRCRCGKPYAEPHEGCAWHANGSARYAADLLAHIEMQAPTQPTLWQRIVGFVTRKGDPMVNMYLFEFKDKDERVWRELFPATNSLDAFDAFRSSYPYACIMNVYVELFGAE